MPPIILEPCHYTQQGLVHYMSTKGVAETDIIRINDVEQLLDRCQQFQPDVVFINEECFINKQEACESIRQLIRRYPETLFFIFMAISNNHFEEYLYARKNLVVTSKSIKISTLDSLLSNYLQPRPTLSLRQMVNRDIHPLTLSRTEFKMIRMWMDGHDTSQISTQMQIKIKTVSSHKGNIRRKIKTHNKQVIYHVVKLIDNVTSGIYVNMR